MALNLPKSEGVIPPPPPDSTGPEKETWWYVRDEAENHTNKKLLKTKTSVAWSEFWQVSNKQTEYMFLFF